jgi:hypothetical protein
MSGRFRAQHPDERILRQIGCRLDGMAPPAQKPVELARMTPEKSLKIPCHQQDLRAPTERWPTTNGPPKVPACPKAG